MSKYVSIRSLNRSANIRVLNRDGDLTTLQYDADTYLDAINNYNQKQLNSHVAIGQWILIATDPSNWE